jgi:hypothetical protein
MKHFVFIRIGFLVSVCCLGSLFLAAQQRNNEPAVISSPGFRIAGTVVSKRDGHPLARARVIVADVKNTRNFQSTSTSEDGRYEFNNLPAGKYSLTGAKRGFITVSFDQHDQYSTAIVTGDGIDTEHLTLRLAPDAIIAGKVLDEAGEPVRHATVTLYYNDHSSGVDQVHQFRSSQSDDLGDYEMTPLQPGTYFLSVNAKPWYAIHPGTQPSNSGTDNPTNSSPMADRALDVAYPLTYYPDVTEAEEAQPIPIRGGEHIEADIHLTPVPSLRLRFRVSEDGRHGYTFPQLEQPAFDGSTFVPTAGGNIVSPGIIEVTGIPAGRYNIHFPQQGASVEMNGVDLTRDGEEIDASQSEPVGSLKFSVRMQGSEAIPQRLSIGLLPNHHRFAAVKQVDAKGEAEMDQVGPGDYEVAVFGPGARYAIAHMSAEGGNVSGHSLNVTPGSSLLVSLSVATGTTVVEGKVTKSGKGFAGAMVVLVPKDPDLDVDLFRRDQSDLDGTFALQNVVPGSYTLLAIDNGWDLDWSQPRVIAAYAKHGRKVGVGENGKQTMNITEPIEAQPK